MWKTYASSGAFLLKSGNTTDEFIFCFSAAVATTGAVARVAPFRVPLDGTPSVRIRKAFARAAWTVDGADTAVR